MLEQYPKVVIIYLSFNSEVYLDDVISSLERISYPKEKIEFVIVDNPHPQHGSSVRALQEKFLPLSGVSIPHVTILPQNENLGFAAGNNAGIKWAMERGFDYIYFHNNDGFMAADCLTRLVEAMEKDRQIGAAQSLLLLYPETNLVNSAGNAFHYLGFGYCAGFRKKKEDLKIGPVEEVGYASGASMIMRVPLLKEYGLWEEDFFLYHEDLEYSLRMKAEGFKTVIVKEAVFYHKYAFSRNQQKFYFMERNRYAVMLMYFKWPTLILLLPMELIMELGLIVFAAMNGWLKERGAVYKYWLSAKNWKNWLAKRARIQAMRKMGDRELLRAASSRLVFEEKSIDNPLLKYIGNPLMAAYWFIIKHLIFW